MCYTQKMSNGARSGEYDGCSNMRHLRHKSLDKQCIVLWWTNLGIAIDLCDSRSSCIYLLFLKVSNMLFDARPRFILVKKNSNPTKNVFLKFLNL